MLKLGKFLHNGLSGIKSEDTFDSFASVHCSCHSQILGGENSSLTALE